jgi:phage terminase Nu1 subunit (DNA packaging protein)
MGKLVNQAELSEILGVSDVTLWTWGKEGLPIARSAELRGLAHEYDTADVIRWWLQRELTKAQVRSPRDRLDEVRAQREELALQRDRRELIDVKEIRPLLERFVQDNVAVMDGIPEKYAPLLQQTPDTEGKHQLLKDAMREVREGLGNYQFTTEAQHGN